MRIQPRSWSGSEEIVAEDRSVRVKKSEMG